MDTWPEEDRLSQTHSPPSLTIPNSPSLSISSSISLSSSANSRAVMASQSQSDWSTSTLNDSYINKTESLNNNNESCTTLHKNNESSGNNNDGFHKFIRKGVQADARANFLSFTTDSHGSLPVLSSVRNAADRSSISSVCK